MTDEEIVELSKLKADRDRLRHETRDVKHMDRDYGENLGKNKSWLANLINRNIKLTHNVKRGVLKASGYMEHFELNTSDFENEVVKARVREIQSKVNKLVEAEVGKLDKDITKALKDYDGRPIKEMMAVVLKGGWSE